MVFAFHLIWLLSSDIRYSWEVLSRIGEEGHPQGNTFP